MHVHCRAHATAFQAWQLARATLTATAVACFIPRATVRPHGETPPTATGGLRICIRLPVKGKLTAV